VYRSATTRLRRVFSHCDVMSHQTPSRPSGFAYLTGKSSLSMKDCQPHYLCAYTWQFAHFVLQVQHNPQRGIDAAHIFETEMTHTVA
jgi:hypothetical protein